MFEIPVHEPELISDLDATVHRMGHFLGYQPTPGSIIIARDPDLMPTCLVMDDLFDEIQAEEDPVAALAEHLRIFGGQSVMVAAVVDGDGPPPHADFIAAVLRKVGAKLTFGFSVHTRVTDILWEHLPDRQTYLDNGGQAEQDASWDRVERVLDGEEPWPGGES